MSTHLGVVHQTRLHYSHGGKEAAQRAVCLFLPGPTLLGEPSFLLAQLSGPPARLLPTRFHYPWTQPLDCDEPEMGPYTALSALPVTAPQTRGAPVGDR